MSQNESDLTPVTERLDYPPLLNVIVPAIILVVSAAYAWSLWGIVNADMNLLLLRPLFVAIWVLLLIILLKDVIPSIRLHGALRAMAQPSTKVSNQRFAPGTEAGAGLIVAATFAFSFVSTGRGPYVYVASTFLYLVIAGYLIGDRKPVRLLMQAILGSLGIYLIMGVVLGVRL